VNFTFYYAEDVLKLIIQFELNCKKDKNDRNYEKQIIKTSVSTCRIGEGVLGSFAAKMIMENYDKLVGYSLKCPYKKVS
jgi:hypothetical protein